MTLPGLRFGTVPSSRSSLVLDDAEWIRGVRVSGRLDARGRGTVTVGGPSAAPGAITLSRDGARSLMLGC